MSRWREATAVTAVGEGCYEATIDLGWSIGGNPHGGYLLATVARAATAASGAPHPLAVSGHFLRPPAGGPAEIRTEVVKQCRTASTVRATLRQEGKARLDMLVTTGRLPDAHPEYDGAPMPTMPAPEECRARQETGATVAIADHVDVRLDPATSLTNGGGVPLIRGWMAFRDGSDLDVESLLLAADVAPPTVAHLGYRGWAPTVELSCLLRSAPSTAVGGGWLAFEAKATQVAGMWFDEEATVWDGSGRLVAQSRQLALVGRPT